MRLALFALAFLGLCPGPTEPLERFTLETRFGPLQVVGNLGDIPALQEGAELAWARAARELPGRVGEFPGVLAGWEAIISGPSSSINGAARRMRICDSSPACTTHGFFHELGYVVAKELGSCPHLASIWAFPPGRTLACEPY